jgi:hypothetical protein
VAGIADGMGGTIAGGMGAGPSGGRSSYLLGRRYVRLGLPVEVSAGGGDGAVGAGGGDGTGGRGIGYASSISTSFKSLLPRSSGCVSVRCDLETSVVVYRKQIEGTSQHYTALETY